MRYHIPGSIIQRAVESVGSQLGDTISNIPDMLRAKEERERRRRLEDEDRIARNSQIEWQRRREATADSRADTLFNQGQKDYEAQAPVRERAIKEGSISSNFKNRRTSILNSLNDPEYTDLGQFVAGAGDDEEDFNARMEFISEELKKRAAAKQKAEEAFRLRVAYANRPPDAFELYKKKDMYDYAKDLRSRGFTPENLPAIVESNQQPLPLPPKTGTEAYMDKFVPDRRAEFNSITIDPQVADDIRAAYNNPYTKLPIGVVQSQQVLMDLRRAQAEKQRQPNASVEAQLARLDLRKREQVNRALQQYYEGKVDDRTFHAQLKSLGLSNEEIASLFEGPPDNP